MRWAWCAVAGLSLWALVDAPAAWARGGARNPPPPPPPEWRGARPRAPAPAPAPAAAPLVAPPVQGYVPVPDVRGMSHDEALRAIYEAGLTPGEVERVSLAQLEKSHGRTYRPGIVVQQAPRPSAGESPSWLPRGAPVFLRLSAGTAIVTPPPVAPVPTPPGTPQPLPPPVPYTEGPDAPGLPPAPPPPSWPGVTPAPGPATVPYVPPATQPLDPTPYEPAFLGGGTVAPRLRLACERGRAQWHFRAFGGWAWWFGADSGDSGVLAGGDLGHTFGDCFGVDVFYRYASTRFDRTSGGVTFKDGGDIHFFGAKATYEAAVSRGSPWFFWGSLGAGYFTTARYTNNDSGFGILGEAGLGYLIDRNLRVRLGVDINALLTNTGRNDPANDGSRRWLTSVAPTLGIEIDF